MSLVEHLSDAADQISAGRVNAAAILPSQKFRLRCFDFDESEVIREAIFDKEVGYLFTLTEKVAPPGACQRV